MESSENHNPSITSEALPTSNHGRQARRQDSLFKRFISHRFTQAVIGELVFNFSSQWAMSRQSPNNCIPASPISDGPQTCPYGDFPKPGDSFHWIPCTIEEQLRPCLGAADPEDKWASMHDADPSHWRWGNETNSTGVSSRGGVDKSHEANSGLWYCGYFDVDDKETPRRGIATMYDPSGLTPLSSCVDSMPTTAVTDVDRTEDKKQVRVWCKRICVERN